MTVCFTCGVENRAWAKFCHAGDAPLVPPTWGAWFTYGLMNTPGVEAALAVLLVVCDLSLALAFLLAFLAGAHTQAAPLRNAIADADPHIQAITVTSNIPISDTRPGEGITKTVYFNNAVPGVITLTFEISGTPTLTLTAGAAFGVLEQVFTSSTPPWRPVVTYSVGTGSGDYAGVAYTAINTGGVQTTIAITYLQDITAPTILTPSIVEVSDYLYAVGTCLYYTNTMSLPKNFAVRGYSSDGASGVNRVSFSPAFGDSPADVTSGFHPWQSGSYGIDPGETVSGLVTATVADQVGNTAIQTYTYALDGTPPESTVSAPAYAITSPITITWAATDTQSGVSATTLWYKKTVTDAWTFYQTIYAGSGAFDFDPPAGDGLYLFSTVAADNLGNLEAGPTVSETQTVYDTHEPQSEVTWAPQYRNRDPITVTWVATPSLAPLTEVRLWYRFDSGTWTTTTNANDVPSGVFTFTPASGDGAYYFTTVAQDAYGKSEAKPTGDGDRTTMYDTVISPTAGLTVTPAAWTNVNAFTVTWDNPADLSGIAGVRYSVDVTPTGDVSGTLRATPGITTLTNLTVTAEGEHTVWVWLVDNATNVNYTTAQTVALRYDTSITAPVNLTVTPAAWTNANTFTVKWDNPADLSGIAGVRYSVDVTPAGDLSGTLRATPGITTLTSLTVTAEGTHTVWIWLEDSAGNVDHTTAQTASLRYDATPPTTVTITAPEHISATQFLVSWSAQDATSGVATYTIAYSGTADTAWQAWLTNTTATSGTSPALAPDTDYIFRVTAYDRAGNSDWRETTTHVGAFYIYLPLVVRNYPPPWRQADGTNDISFYDISVCPYDSRLQYAGTSADGLYHSIDGGETWQRWALDGRATPVVVNPTNCAEAFVATWGSGVYRVTGQNQATPINQGLDELYLYGLVISGQTLYAGTATRGVYKTDISNVNWTAINTGISDLRIRSLYLINDTLYAGGRQCTYYYSNNGGNSWSPETILSGGQGGACQDAQTWAIAQVDSVLYAGLGLDKGLYRRSAGGTWTQVSDVPTVTIYRFGLYHYLSHLYVGTYGYGVYTCEGDGRCRPLPNSGLGTSNIRGITVAEVPDVYPRLLAGSDDGLWWVPLVPE